jgi:hypothetical protein
VEADLGLDRHSSYPYWAVSSNFSVYSRQARWICARAPASNSRREFNEAFRERSLNDIFIRRLTLFGVNIKPSPAIPLLKVCTLYIGSGYYYTSEGEPATPPPGGFWLATYFSMLLLPFGNTPLMM